MRYLTPHNKWSIHSEYQDNLFMLSLSRGGPTMWMSPADAAKIAVRDNGGGRAVNRNGVLVCRAIVSHRMPDGVVFVYHAQERTIDVPLTGPPARGGIHNSLTRLLVKPTHLAGGYAQTAFAFNYLGPTGNQRDRSPSCGDVLRRWSTDARHGPDGDGDEPRQMYRLPHLLGDMQTGLDQPAGHQYVWFNNVETRPGQVSPPTRTRTAGAVGGCDAKGRLRLRGGGRLHKAAAHLLQPEAASIGDYYEPWTRLRQPHQRSAGRTLPVARPRSLISGKPMKVGGRRTGTTIWAAHRRSWPAIRYWQRSARR